jgi:hypothetical protein
MCGNGRFYSAISDDALPLVLSRSHKKKKVVLQRALVYMRVRRSVGRLMEEIGR